MYKIILFFIIFIIFFGQCKGKRIPPPRDAAIKDNFNMNYAPKRSNFVMKAPFKPNGNPIEGILSILIVPFAFKDKDFSNGINEELLDEFRDYYRSVSNNKLDVNFIIAPTVRSEHNYTFYSADIEGIDSSNGHEIYELAREAVNLLIDIGFEFSVNDFDKDGDGIIDHFMIIHAGDAQEYTNNSNDIWSHMWTIINGLDDERYPDDTQEDGEDINPNLKVLNYTLFSNSSPLGIMVHEFGHDLGLVDFYDIDNSSSGIGNWGLMGTGCWNGPDYDGSVPALLCAYNRYYLGWTDVEDITAGDGNFILPKIGVLDKVYKIQLSDSEYFLLENRQKEGYDTYLPGSGLLIWHIDENILSNGWSQNDVNSNESHKGVDLEEADGGNMDNSPIYRGDSGDPFPGSQNKISFTPNTNPSSNSYYSDIKSAVFISNIVENNNGEIEFYKTGSFGYYVGVFNYPTDEKFKYISIVTTKDLLNDFLEVGMLYNDSWITKEAYFIRNRLFMVTCEVSDVSVELNIRLFSKIDSGDTKEAEFIFNSPGVMERFIAPMR